MYYPCSENIGADQLRGYREADLRLCFRICQKPVFSLRGSIKSLMVTEIRKLEGYMFKLLFYHIQILVLINQLCAHYDETWFNYFLFNYIMSENHQYFSDFTGKLCTTDKLKFT